MTGSLEPVAWRITCAAADCQPERWRPVTRPIELQGTRAEVIAQLKKLGWVQCRTARSLSTTSWHCPKHARPGGAS